MEDEDDELPGQVVVEYDLVYKEAPADLEEVIRQCFRVARAAGVGVGWFGFEGSFRFSALLTARAAHQVFAVMDSHGVAIASDEALRSEHWALRVASAGNEVRASVAK